MPPHAPTTGSATLRAEAPPASSRPTPLATCQGRMSPDLTETEPGPGDTTHAGRPLPPATAPAPCPHADGRMGVMATEANREASPWNTCRGEAQTAFRDRGHAPVRYTPHFTPGKEGRPGPPPNAVSYLWMGIFKYTLFLSTSGSAQFFSEAGGDKPSTPLSPRLKTCWRRSLQVGGSTSLL